MRFRTIPNWLHKPSHNFDLTWAPLSVVIVAGVPKRAIHPLKKASATVSTRISTIEMASGQRVKRSTQVSKYPRVVTFEADVDDAFASTVGINSGFVSCN